MTFLNSGIIYPSCYIVFESCILLIYFVIISLSFPSFYTPTNIFIFLLKSGDLQEINQKKSAQASWASADKRGGISLIGRNVSGAGIAAALGVAGAYVDVGGAVVVEGYAEAVVDDVVLDGECYLAAGLFLIGYDLEVVAFIAEIESVVVKSGGVYFAHIRQVYVGCVSIEPEIEIGESCLWWK